MAFTLFDATIPPMLQMLDALKLLIGKAEAHCAEHGIAAEEMIEAKLAPDMLPFGYQVKSAKVHSANALQSVAGGVFSPDTSPWPEDFAGLTALLDEAHATVAAVDRAALDALAGNAMAFVMGSYRADYPNAGEFLARFSLPNFYFHATTAYDLLRMKGVTIGKRDFFGRAPG